MLKEAKVKSREKQQDRRDAHGMRRLAVKFLSRVAKYQKQGMTRAKARDKAMEVFEEVLGERVIKKALSKRKAPPKKRKEPKAD